MFVPRVTGPVPFVQPGSPTRPSAFDQPPAYHAHDRPAALSRSPIVGEPCGGSRRSRAVPGEYGCESGCVVLTAQSPHTLFAWAGLRGGLSCCAGVDGQLSVNDESATVPVAL